MKVVIDTNSLLSLVRYYLPFDNNLILFNFIKEKLLKGEIIVIDKVLVECTFNAKGIIIQKLNYLADKEFLKKARIPYKTDDLIAPAPAKFLRQLDNQFVNSIVRKQRKLTDVEYENQKSIFLESADMKLIILSLNLKKNVGDQVFLVTEETEHNNDNKLFKKIPAICSELDIPTITLPELFAKYPDIKIDFK